MGDCGRASDVVQETHSEFTDAATQSEVSGKCSAVDSCVTRVYCKWDENNMKIALHRALERQYSGEPLKLSALARQWDVPIDTLRRRMRSGNYENYRHSYIRENGSRSAHSHRILFQWDECNMKEALRICLDDQKKGNSRDKMSIKQVARDWNVPLSTLYKRVRSGDYGNYRHGGCLHMKKREQVDDFRVETTNKGMWNALCHVQ